jgi:hypothetical protein
MEIKMRSEPQGVNATFKVTVTYLVSVSADNEEEAWYAIEDLSPAKISEEDVVDVAYELTDIDRDGF